MFKGLQADNFATHLFFLLVCHSRELQQDVAPNILFGLGAETKV
jgi:hypothetical protein